MKVTDTQLFINGQTRATSRRIPQINPATEETFAEVHAASVADIDAAVLGAQKSFDQEWRDLIPRRKTEIFFALLA